MFICMQKSHFIFHFFPEILHFKESCNLIGWQHPELESCQIWDWRWNINNNISFNFKLFRRKTNGKVFWKMQKQPGHSRPFLPKFEQKWIFSGKNIPIIYHNAKNQQKLLSNFWGKHQTDGQLQAAASLKIYDSITSGTFTRI